MDKLLYDRLGGSAGITQIVNEVVQAHMNNPAINARFLPLKEQPEHLASITKHTIEFFSVGSGGQKPTRKRYGYCNTGMNISRGEFITCQ
jgi:hemoglobin